MNYDTLFRCMRCGFCLSVCPTYRESAMEPAAPRGRVALIKALAEGKLPVTENLTRYIYGCLECLACTAMCPSGVRVDELVGAAKERINKEYPPSYLSKFILEDVLASPRKLDHWLMPLRVYQRLGLQPLGRSLGGIFSERWRGLNDLLPPLPLHPLTDEIREVVPAKGETKRRVGFFLACIQNMVLTDTSKATINVLRENHCDIVVPKGLKCCGMPYRGYGEIEMAREMARHNIEAFEAAGVEIIVTDCATCGSFTKEYGSLLKDDEKYSERAQAFSRKVQDITQFLTSAIELKPPAEWVIRVTYHDPCHLLRGQKVAQEPRRVLSLIPGLKLVEMKEADWCCGGAGSYNLTHYDLSMRILDRKMANIKATGASFVATGCPGCQLQLRLGVKRARLLSEVLHPVQLLAQAYERLD